MARSSGITQRDGITLGDVRQWLTEVSLSDDAYLFGKISLRNKVTELRAQEDKIKEGGRP
jgi:hypothetical protein